MAQITFIANPNALYSGRSLEKASASLENIDIRKGLGLPLKQLKYQFGEFMVNCLFFAVVRCGSEASPLETEGSLLSITLANGRKVETTVSELIKMNE